MSSLGSDYDDTLRSLKTGKNESPLGSLKKYLQWGSSQDALPYSNREMSKPEGSILSWPPWSSTNNQPPFYEHFGLSLMQRYAAFALCIIGAALLFFLAFMHIPLVILRPGKFVIPYCLGNLLVFLSFGFIHGFYSYTHHLFSSTRWPFSTAFLGTTFLTLYVAMVLRMYALTILIAIIQFMTLIAYTISYLPGGTGGISAMGSFAASSVRSRMGVSF